MDITPESNYAVSERGSGHMALVNGMSSSDGSVSPTALILRHPATRFVVRAGMSAVTDRAINVVAKQGQRLLSNLNIDYQATAPGRAMGPFGRSLDEYRISKPKQVKTTSRMRRTIVRRAKFYRPGEAQLMWIKHPY